MRVIEDANQLEWNASSRLESPFAEAASETVDAPTKAVGFAPWSDDPDALHRNGGRRCRRGRSGPYVR